MAYDLNKIKELYKKELEKEAKKESYENGEGNNYLKLEKGSNLVRILPVSDEKPFFTHTKLHVLKNAEGKIRYYHCLKVHGEDCPLCDAYFEIWKRDKAAGANGKSALALKFGSGQSTIKPKPRYYMNVINRKDNSVKVLSAPDQIYKKIIANMSGDEELNIEELGDVTNIETGYDFNVIVGTNKGQDGKEYTSYAQSEFKRKPNPAAASKLEVEKALESRHNLDSLVKKESYDELKQLADVILSGNSMEDKPTQVETEVTPTAKVLTEEEFRATLKG